jgi:hypothetical protein
MSIEITGWEAPTLEGRALCDLGQQVAAWRAKAERYEAVLRDIATHAPAASYGRAQAYDALCREGVTP